MEHIASSQIPIVTPMLLLVPLLLAPSVGGMTVTTDRSRPATSTSSLDKATTTKTAVPTMLTTTPQTAQTPSVEVNERSERVFQSFLGSLSREEKKEAGLRRTDKQAKKMRKSRKHRRHHHQGVKRRSCRTVSRYVRRHEGEDMWGNLVTIYPHINIGAFQIEQMFYESFCYKEQCKCSGIDRSRYTSSCKTEYSFTYARVIKGDQLGWTHIKVRSGCSCVIREHVGEKRTHVTDIL